MLATRTQTAPDGTCTVLDTHAAHTRPLLVAEAHRTSECPHHHHPGVSGLRYGDKIHLRNGYGSTPYLEVRSTGCEGNAYCVSASSSNTRAGTSGTWTVTSTDGRDGAVHFGDSVHLQNQFGSKPYLDTRDPGCKGNVYCVSASNTETRGGATGTWTLTSSDGKSGVVQFGETVHLQNGFGSKPYLDTRSTGCEGNVYCVSAANSKTRDGASGAWTVMGKAPFSPPFHSTFVALLFYVCFTKNNTSLKQ